MVWLWLNGRVGSSGCWGSRAAQVVLLANPIALLLPLNPSASVKAVMTCQLATDRRECCSSFRRAMSASWYDGQD